MLNYEKQSRIFPCILLTRNHMKLSANYAVDFESQFDSFDMILQ